MAPFGAPDLQGGWKEAFYGNFNMTREAGAGLSTAQLSSEHFGDGLTRSSGSCGLGSTGRHNIAQDLKGRPGGV